MNEVNEASPVERVVINQTNEASMKTIRENIETTRLYVDRPVYRKFSIIPDDSILPEPVGFSVRRGWRAQFTVGTDFYCMDSQKDEAFKNAEKLILQTIHSESLRHIAAIKQAIYSGDDEIALALLDDMRDTFGL